VATGHALNLRGQADHLALGENSVAFGTKVREEVMPSIVMVMRGAAKSAGRRAERALGDS
jgi:hypothetical protein